MPVPAATHLALAKVAADEARSWTARRDDAVRKAMTAGATAADVRRAVGTTLSDPVTLIKSL